MKEFSEDEKIIARNIHKGYKWMVRDKNGGLFAYTFKPIKKEKTGIWDDKPHYCVSALFGQELFRAIKWEDDEPTRISDIYDPQILDDAEREYLGTVLKPFHKKVVYVAKYRVPSASGKDGYSKEQLSIAFYSGGFVFPDFDPGKMYSGMELGKKYKLDELGITYKDGENK